MIEIRRHQMGMVFQHFALLPHLTVLDNVAFPLDIQGMSRAAARGAAREMIELVGLAGKERPFRGSFPAASNSASASPARSPWSRRSGSSTSPSRRSIR
jgi:ABC-type ATPase involved in cell division